MEMMGQGLVLMIFGMGFVYLFLWLMIVVIRHSSRFVCKFEHLLPDDAPKPKRQPVVAVAQQLGDDGLYGDVALAHQAQLERAAGLAEVKAPVPGTVLRLTASNRQQVRKGDELLVMDVMKADKVATGDVVAIVA